jgi:predicted dehydrogenase
MIMKAERIRYAVVGLGHIAQESVLPAFAHARHAELAALVSSDPAKLRRLGRHYGVRALYDYDAFELALEAEDIDAVYIALPNDLHREYTERAAAAGVHVLCEKPMATSEEDARAMLDAVRAASVKLMIAYRLHFEEANLRAVELARSGRLGQLRAFNSTFTMKVRPGNIRVKRERGGGPGWDIGIYCVNAARYLFGEEPLEVAGFAGRGRSPRFQGVEENLAAVLRFPEGRVATFVCGFGSASVVEARLLGTKGDLRLDPAFSHAGPRGLTLTIDDKSRSEDFAPADQFAPLLERFAVDILEDREPAPGGLEGLADVRVLEAIYRSARTGTAMKVEPVRGLRRPQPAKRARRRPSKNAPLVNVESPREDA